MILPRTRPCRKERPTPKKLEGDHSGRGRHGYGMLCLKKGPNQPGPIFSTLYIFSYTFLILIFTPFRIPITYAPDFLYFCDPISRLPFATHIRNPSFVTPIRDPHLRPKLFRLTFATPIHDPHSRPTFRDPTRDSHLRLTFATPFSQLTFATPLATHISDSHPRIHL